MVVMAMRKRDGIHFLMLDKVVKREAGAAFALGMRAGIHEQAVAFEFNEPCAGADVGVGIEVGNSHAIRSMRPGRSQNNIDFRKINLQKSFFLR